MEHNWNLEELHNIRAHINKEIDAITKEQLNNLYEQLNTVNQLITEYKDGYIYWVCIRSYGSKRWRQVYNREAINELIDQYQDGYDGVIDIYSNNPRLIKKIGKETYWCDTYYSLDDLPEEKRNSGTGNPYSDGVTQVLMAIIGK